MQDHNKLIDEGIVDYLNGNESYAARYYQGVLFSNGITSVNNVDGNEGLLATIWEKVKQFCAWFVGLFTGKKETGIKTKEVGIKTGIKVKKEIVTVTPVKKSEIKPEEPAPKAHAPTPEQKTSDKVKMVVVEKAAEPEKKEEPKEVTLAMVPQKLGYLFAELQKLNNVVNNDVKKLVKDYEDILRLRDSLGEEYEPAFSGFTKMPASEFESKFKSVLDGFKQWEKLPASYTGFSVENITNIADDKISSLCKKIVDVTNDNHFVPSEVSNRNMTKEKLYQIFESHIKKAVDEEKREVLCKVLVKYMRWDFNIWCILDHSDVLADIKMNILDGKYFVRAPQ